METHGLTNDQLLEIAYYLRLTRTLEERLVALLERGMVAEVDKAATHAFSLPFLLAGAIAALALVPIYLGRRS